MKYEAAKQFRKVIDCKKNYPMISVWWKCSFKFVLGEDPWKGKRIFLMISCLYVQKSLWARHVLSHYCWTDSSLIWRDGLLGSINLNYPKVFILLPSCKCRWFCRSRFMASIPAFTFQIFAYPMNSNCKNVHFHLTGDNSKEDFGKLTKYMIISIFLMRVVI